MASVDVVIPSYNYRGYLEGCVRSVLDQSGVDVRVLVIDNASTDGSADLARDLASRDGRVEVRARARNLGPHASFNEGVDWAAADYFLILCADDLLAPGALARAAGVMERHRNVHLTYGRTISFRGDDAVPVAPDRTGESDWNVVAGIDLRRRFCETTRNHCHGPTCVVRTEVQKRVGHYRTNLSHTDDLELWLRFTLHGDAAETDAVQAFSRTHRANQSARVAGVLEWNREFEAAFEQFFTHEGRVLPDAEMLLKTARRSLGERAYWSALRFLCRGEVAAAGRLMLYAAQRAPWSMVVPPVGSGLRQTDTFRRIAARAGSSVGRS